MKKDNLWVSVGINPHLVFLTIKLDDTSASDLSTLSHHVGVEGHSWTQMLGLVDSVTTFHGTICMMWMFPKIVGFPPKSSILIGFSIINHPFWGTPIFGNTHVFVGSPAKRFLCALSIHHKVIGFAQVPVVGMAGPNFNEGMAAWCISKMREWSISQETNGSLRGPCL